MKKSLLALAVLGAFAGVASAQSSVTLFGTVDLAGTYVKNDGSSRRLSLTKDGINSSQFGVRGVEDLGGGLKASFVLLAGVDPDVGGSSTATTPNAAATQPAGTFNQSKFWNRKSTVSLISNGGELRLGRDYVPTFWNMTIFDAFGTNGVGSSLNVSRYFQVRSDNSIGYFLPSNLGGFYGQVMVAAAESGTTLDKPGRHTSGRVGFAAGPFDIALAYGQQRFDVGQAPNISGDKVKTTNLGGSYDFGFLKLMGYIQKDSLERSDQKLASLSAVIPFGQSEVHLGYDRSKYKVDATGTSTPSTSSTIDQIKATYQYNLSKRTAMYGTVSRLDNKDLTSNAIAGGNSITAGGNSKGFQVGVRHFF